HYRPSEEKLNLDEPGQQARNQAVQQGASAGPPEAVDAESFQDGARQPEHQGVQNEQEQAQRDDGDRQGQQNQDGLDQGVQQAQDQRGDQGRSKTGQGNAGQHVGDNQQGNSIQQPNE